MTARQTFWFAGKQVSIRGYDENDWIYQTIRRSRCFYEIDLLKYMRHVVGGRRGVIFDIGANIGNHTVFFGLFTNCLVASFEPNPDVRQILEQNVSDNGLEAIIYDVGLGSRQGRFSVDVPVGAEHNIGAARLRSDDSGAVRVETLDSLADDALRKLCNQQLVAIKADIEGMEPDMLAGATATLARYKPDLFLEISTDDGMARIMSTLRSIGYRRLTAWAATPVWHFVHEDRYTLPIRLGLGAYTLSARGTRLVSACLGGIKRRLSA